MNEVDGLDCYPVPCQRYDWPEESECRWTLGSGTHACRLAAGHAGPCCCAACGSVALRRRTEPAPPWPTPLDVRR